MEEIILSKRLKLISSFVIEDNFILDIGSNHAYLPIYLIQKNKVPYAIASELTYGPYKQAFDEVAKHKLQDKIEIRLGDGLEVLKEEEIPGTIFICGMGSKTIENILFKANEAHKLPRNSRLVLQPNKNEKDLRQYLQNHNYKIIDEGIVEENKKIYEIIVVKAVTERIFYSEEELLFGPKLLEKPSATFIKKWKNKLKIYENLSITLAKDTSHPNYEKVKQKINCIKKVLT